MLAGVVGLALTRRMVNEGATPNALPAFLEDPVCRLFAEMTTLLPAVAFAKDSNGRYVYVNQHYVSSVLNPTYGVRPAVEYLNRHNRDLGSLPERFDWVDAQESLVMQSDAVVHFNERYSTEHRARGHAFGVRFPLRTASGVYLGALFVDVTVEEAANRAAELTQASFRGLFDGSSTAIVALTDSLMTDDGNSSACEMFGMLTSELCRKSIYDLIHPGDRDRVAALERQLGAGPHDRYQTATTFRRSDGVVFHARLTRIRRTRVHGDGDGPSVSFATMDVLPPGALLAAQTPQCGKPAGVECENAAEIGPARPTSIVGRVSTATSSSTTSDSRTKSTVSIALFDIADDMDSTGLFVAEHG